MSTTNTKEHWEKVYREKDPSADVSWYQVRPSISIRLVQVTGVAHDQPVIDIGGGASSLVDCLLDAGFQDLTVLDISAAALGPPSAGSGRLPRLSVGLKPM